MTTTLATEALSLQDVLQFTVKASGVPPRAIAGGRRHRRVVIARQAFCYLATMYTLNTQEEIAMLSGHTDRSTVSSSVTTVESALEMHENGTAEGRLKAWCSNVHSVVRGAEALIQEEWGVLEDAS